MYFSPMSVVLFEISHWSPKGCMLFWVCTFKSILVIGAFSRNLLSDPKPARSINQHGRVYVPMDWNIRLSFILNRYELRTVLLIVLLFYGFFATTYGLLTTLCLANTVLVAVIGAYKLIDNFRSVESTWNCQTTIYLSQALSASTIV